MKLALVFGSVLFLVAGIRVAGNSQEVTGLSDLELTNIAANTTANATGAAMEEANKLLEAAKNASAKATQTGIEQAKSVMANVTNNVSTPTSNTTGTAMNEANATANVSANATEGGLKKYENARYGISFMYPPEWGTVSDDCPQYKNKDCGPRFAIMVNDTTALDAAPMEKLTSAEILEKIFRSIDLHNMGVLVYELDKPSENAKACNCNTLKDFLVWDYNKRDPQSVTFINDNQTTVGKNHSAWQTEITSFGGGVEAKLFSIYAINGGIGYKFIYNANQGVTFDRYLEGFKNMLKTVTFTPPTTEKKPSFLNSSDTVDTSVLPSTPTVQDNSFKILSSNDFIDSIGTLHVVGEVENNTPTNAQFVKITGTFYDSSNNVVGTDFTYTDPSDIGSGQKAPFDLTLLSASIPISQVDHYNLVASSQ